MVVYYCLLKWTDDWLTTGRTLETSTKRWTQSERRPRLRCRGLTVVELKERWIDCGAAMKVKWISSLFYLLNWIYLTFNLLAHLAETLSLDFLSVSSSLSSSISFHRNDMPRYTNITQWNEKWIYDFIISAIHMYQAGSGCIYNLRFSGIEEDATNALQTALSIGPLCCDTFLSFSFSSSTFTFPFVVFFYTFPCTYPDLHICTWPPATTWFRSVFPIRGLWTFSIPLHTHLMPWRQSIFFVL